MTVEKQIAIIYLGTKGLLVDVPIEKVKEFENTFVTYLETHHKEVLNELKAGKLTDEVMKKLEEVGKDMAKKYKAVV